MSNVNSSPFTPDASRLTPDASPMRPDTRIHVAGHTGLVGSAIVRCLQRRGYKNLLLRPSRELDLTDQRATSDFFRSERPEVIFLAAARVGGILANATHPGEFIHLNLAIQDNVMHQAMVHGVKNLLFLGSSCIYPKHAPQPMQEEHLLSGPLEPTNEPYAIAKIAGIEMCWAYNRQYDTRYIPVMPTNLYGPNDNFDLHGSHVLPAMLRKFHLAKLAAAGDMAGICRDMQTFGPVPEDILGALGIETSSKLKAESSKQEEERSSKRSLPFTPHVSPLTPHASRPQVVLWGSGTPRREFLHVDDLARACVHIMEQPFEEVALACADRAYDKGFAGASGHGSQRVLLNIGSGVDATILDIASLVADVVGYRGEVTWDAAKPDGTPRKLLDVSRMNSLGWRPKLTLRQGLTSVYQWYREKIEEEG